MRLVMIFLVLLGAIFAAPLVFHGIRYNEPGFWVLVGFGIVIFLVIRWKLEQLRRDPPSQRPLRSPGER